MKIHCPVREVEKLNTRVKTIPESEAKVCSNPSDEKHSIREKRVKFSHGINSKAVTKDSATKLKEI